MAILYSITGLARMDARLLEQGVVCAFLEGPAEAGFVEIRDEFDRELALECPYGVAFGPSREVKWLQRRDGTVHAVVVDDGSQAPEGAAKLELEELPDETPRQLLLAGERDHGQVFLEGRIPGKLNYPDDSPAKRLAVEIKHYAARDGSRRLWRCVRLTEAE